MQIDMQKRATVSGVNVDLPQKPLTVCGSSLKRLLIFIINDYGFVYFVAWNVRNGSDVCLTEMLLS